MDKVPTDIQNEIIKKDGRFVVRACPGSGKTFTVAAKMAELLKKWPYQYQGIAVISFTNVAFQEIETELNNLFSVNIPIGHPHFLGTIDSFINNFIILPYGHLILECDNRPKLVGEPVFPWKMKRYEYDPYQYFDKFSFDIGGNLSPNTSLDQIPFKWKQFNTNGSEDGHYTNIKKMKNYLLKNGNINQSDADYFSMKLLENYQSIAETIALRFPYIIIDEAQDTSKIQMRIIEILVENGLKDIILVGDPDQAIFEWNGAKPELFIEKMVEWNNSITMNENWRSSQNICNFTFYLSDLQKKSASVNEIHAYPFEPHIWGYDHTNPNFDKLIFDFLELCKSENITPNQKDVAILSRSNSLLNQIVIFRNEGSTTSVRNSNPWNKENFAKELLYSKYLYDNAEFQKSFRLLEKTYMSIIEGRIIYSDYELSELIDKLGYFDFKKKIFDFIHLMPKTDKSIADWISEFKVNLEGIDIFSNLDLSINEEYKNFNFDDLFVNEVMNNEYPYNLSTIHKVKGETFEAILLIIKKKGKGAQYKTLLKKGEKNFNNEELRIIYVGITRPRKILVLAVPSDDEDVWKEYLSEKPQRTLFDF